MVSLCLEPLHHICKDPFSKCAGSGWTYLLGLPFNPLLEQSWGFLQTKHGQKMMPNSTESRGEVNARTASGIQNKVGGLPKTLAEPRSPPLHCLPQGLLPPHRTSPRVLPGGACSQGESQSGRRGGRQRETEEQAQVCWASCWRPGGMARGCSGGRWS